MQVRPSNQLVAAAIRRLRRARKLAQEGLAADYGLHRTYIGAIERGEENNTLDKVAQALKVRPIELLR